MGKVKYSVREAQRRNEERAAQRAKDKKRKEFIEKNKTKIISSVIGCILIVLVLFLAVKNFYGPGGSIPNFFGTLRGVQDDWIVTNLGDSSSPRYYKLGSLTLPDGYTIDSEYSISTDSNNQTFRLIPDDASVVSSVYIAGVANRKAEDMLQTYIGFGKYTDATEPKTAEIGGHTVHYVSVLYPSEDVETVDETTQGSRSLVMYMDTARDSSILISALSVQGDMSSRPTEEELVRAVSNVVAGVHLP